MIYPDVDGYYPYYMYDRESLPQLRIIWRILRDRQVVVITESYGRLYYDWDTRSLEDVCQMCHKVYDMALIMNNKE